VRTRVAKIITGARRHIFPKFVLFFGFFYKYEVEKLITLREFMEENYLVV